MMLLLTVLQTIAVSTGVQSIPVLLPLQAIFFDQGF